MPHAGNGDEETRRYQVMVDPELTTTMNSGGADNSSDIDTEKRSETAVEIRRKRRD